MVKAFHQDIKFVFKFVVKTVAKKLHNIFLNKSQKSFMVMIFKFYFVPS